MRIAAHILSAGVILTFLLLPILAWTPVEKPIPDQFTVPASMAVRSWSDKSDVWTLDSSVKLSEPWAIIKTDDNSIRYEIEHTSIETTCEPVVKQVGKRWIIRFKK